MTNVNLYSSVVFTCYQTVSGRAFRRDSMLASGVEIVAPLSLLSFSTLIQSRFEREWKRIVTKYCSLFLRKIKFYGRFLYRKVVALNTFKIRSLLNSRLTICEECRDQLFLPLRFALSVGYSLEIRVLQLEHSCGYVCVCVCVCVCGMTEDRDANGECCFLCVVNFIRVPPSTFLSLSLTLSQTHTHTHYQQRQWHYHKKWQQQCTVQ
jgi:hypothetical protein